MVIFSAGRSTSVTDNNSFDIRILQETPASEFEYTLDEVEEYAVINSYLGNEKEIVIPKTVTKKGMETFCGCSLSSVTFEDGIETLGSYACFWYANLTSITFPASVKESDEYSFNGKLKETYFLGNAPETLGDRPFDENTVIYYKSNTSEWENTELSNYELIAE